VSKPILEIASCEDSVESLRCAVAATLRKAEDAMMNLGADNFKPDSIDVDFINKVFNDNDSTGGDTFNRIYTRAIGYGAYYWVWGTHAFGMESAPKTMWDPPPGGGSAPVNFVDIVSLMPAAYLFRSFPATAYVYLANAASWATVPNPMDTSAGFTRHGHVYAHWENSDDGTSGDKLIGDFDDGAASVSLPDWTDYVFIGDSAWGPGGIGYYASYNAYPPAPSLYVATPVMIDYRPPWLRGQG